MATPEILDFAALLRPISDDQPAGVELRQDERLRAAYQGVKDAREMAREAEKSIRRAMLGGRKEDLAACPRPDWRKVLDLSVQVLSQNSKDLWVAAWLIESLVRLHGFAGLRDGFRVTRELVEKFWDNIHPAPDEDGYLTTVAQLAGLNGDDSEGTLLAPIDQVSITEPGQFPAMSSADYKLATKLAGTDPEKLPEAMREKAISPEAFEKVVREGSPEFYRNLFEDLQQAVDEYFRLGEALDARCGTSPDGRAASPPSSAIRDALIAIRENLQNLASNHLAPAESASEASSDSSASATDAAVGAAPAGGKAAKQAIGRDEALRQLQSVAEYFRKTEPHSPVSYALEQAVRWAKMSLPDLLTELISDSSTRDDLFRRVGLPRAEESNS